MPNEAKAQHIYTVSEVTQDIKLILENTFAEIWVEGEISGISRIPTGTIFFNLKDNLSLLKCVVFPSYVSALKFELKDGLKAVIFGRISVYEKQGSYQLYAQKIEPRGIGSLQLALEQLKTKLEKEGLFSPQRKRAIPYLPSCIGIVTSLQGAAIRDILKVLDRRFKDIRVIINPARVQGEGAKEEIAQAILDLNRLNEEKSFAEKIEVMIVGRGGGSIEDLWAFNEEAVARAIYNSKIPVVSAVGHERDWTVADLVADLRAATPSVAAELVAPKKEDLQARLEELKSGINQAFLDFAQGLWDSLDEMAHRLTLRNPVQVLQQYLDKAGDLVKQINLRMSHLIKLRESEFLKSAQNLSSLSPLNILSRGYSITFKTPEGIIVKDAKSLKNGDTIKTRLHKGEIISQVTEVN
ncbi:MAG: exodeoxyribonuclease VII large subunit [Candidatus Omnitrophota bacterium]